MKIYITDGSLESFYTAVFRAYREKDCIITSCADRQLSFDSVTENIAADVELAGRVRAKLDRTDRYAAGDIDLALRSCSPLK